MLEDLMAPRSRKEEPRVDNLGLRVILEQKVNIIYLSIA
jgi:hypothetical protein